MSSGLRGSGTEWASEVRALRAGADRFKVSSSVQQCAKEELTRCRWLEGKD